MARTRTVNQQLLDQKIGEFKRAYRFGISLLKYLADDDVQVVRVTPGQHGRWFLHLVLPERLREMFDVPLEVLCMATAYKTLEPRALEEVQTRIRDSARVDDAIAVVVSADAGASELARRRRPGETAILALDGRKLPDGREDLRTALARTLVTVDHFNVTTPIQDPSLFFGREKDIERTRNLLAAGQHVGIFGLRKAGKSSLLNQVQRVVGKEGWVSVRLDLNAYAGRSQAFLGDLLARLYTTAKQRELGPGPLLSTGQGPHALEQGWLDDLENLIALVDHRPGVLIVIDEIDIVLPRRLLAFGGSDDDRNRLLRALVQLRGFIQRRQSEGKTYPVILSAGVDPSIFERPVLAGADNPLYQFSQVQFLEPLDYHSLSDMVRMLGRRSGMRFRDYRLIDELNLEYGGHPLLTRRACSWVHNHRDSDEVPYDVTVDVLRRAFAARGTGTPLTRAHDTLEELAQWYPDDAKLIRDLLNGIHVDLDRLEHAVDYGVVDEHGAPRMRALLRRP